MYRKIPSKKSCIVKLNLNASFFMLSGKKMHHSLKTMISNPKSNLLFKPKHIKKEINHNRIRGIY